MQFMYGILLLFFAYHNSLSLNVLVCYVATMAVKAVILGQDFLLFSDLLHLTTVISAHYFLLL